MAWENERSVEEYYDFGYKPIYDESKWEHRNVDPPSRPFDCLMGDRVVRLEGNELADRLYDHEGFKLYEKIDQLLGAYKVVAYDFSMPIDSEEVHKAFMKGFLEPSPDECPGFQYDLKDIDPPAVVLKEAVIALEISKEYLKTFQEDKGITRECLGQAMAILAATADHAIDKLCDRKSQSSLSVAERRDNEKAVESYVKELGDLNKLIKANPEICPAYKTAVKNEIARQEKQIERSIGLER